MKKLLFCIAFFLLICCNKNDITEEYKSFEYKEMLISSDAGHFTEWKLFCEEIKCILAFSAEGEKIEMFSKNIILKDKKEAKKILKKIFKGMKNRKNPESHPDFYPSNELIVNNKEILTTDRQNTRFLKILNELLGEDYREMEQKIEENYRNSQNKENNKN